MIEIGIDEAGYGPLLGPLVVTAWGMSRPGGGDEDIWDALSGAVSRDGRSGKIVVADSKLVYSSSRGIRRIEESVLSFLRASGINTPTYGRLFNAVVQEDTPDESPLWCDPARVPIPVEADPEAIERSAMSLRGAMDESGIHAEYVSSRVVTPRRFNDSVASTGNKLVTLFSQIASLIKDAASRFGNRLSRVTVDNLSSTKYYRKLLQMFLPQWRVETIEESRHMSRYSMTRADGSSFELNFVKKADVKHFLAALSSMQSKYLRELEMRAFNNFWRRELPDIAPTAGYPKDAKRFIAEMDRRAQKLRIPKDHFIRTR